MLVEEIIKNKASLQDVLLKASTDLVKTDEVYSWLN
jgi:hypothetical protein